MKKQTSQTIDEIFEEAEELLEEIEDQIEKLETQVTLPTGETVQVDEIELKELQKLPFGAIY